MPSLSLSLTLGNATMRGAVPDEVVNLLDGLTWTQGGATTMTDEGTRYRATRAGANPRIYKNVTGLTSGATYRLLGGVYIGTASRVIVRVSDTSAMDADGPYTTPVPDWTTDHDVDETFVADATAYFVGPVGVTAGDGDFVEIDEDFALQYVSGP